MLPFFAHVLFKNPIGACVLLAAVLAASSAVAGDRPATSTLVVEIDNLDAGGLVHVGLWRSAEHFLSATALRETQLSPVDGKVVWTIHHLPYGRYAAGAWQDLNGNGKHDSNTFGAPVEPTGVTNNATGHFGPPSFADAVIRVDQPRQHIRFNLSCPMGCIDR